MISITSPCYGCEDRAEGCHDSCERYGEFKRDLQARREYLQRERVADWHAFDATERVCRATGKRIGQM